MRRFAFQAEEDGAAVVEFALVLPILLLMIWGIIEIGRAFYTVNIAASSVREGARLGSTCRLPLTNGVPHMTGACRDSIRASVSRSFKPLGDTLRTSDITISPAPSGAVTGPITVGIDYPYVPLTPLDWTFTMTRSATFRFERGP
ncbi:MAG: pilus assembly protein [Anaerolineae bacterium]|nr:pilus assembly protein [Gemmatimonadaceae bacterium]